MANDAALIVKPTTEVEPVIDNASASAAKRSVLVVIVKVPDPDDDPAAITTSKVSSPAGMV